MSISMLKEYDSFIKKFVNENFDILLTNRKYRLSKEKETALDYIPEHNQTPDSNFIRNTTQFSNLVSSFIDKFINVKDLTFNLQGHFPSLDSKKVSDLIDLEHSYDNRYAINYLRQNLIQSFEFKLLIDVFYAFINIRDKESGNVHYFTFFWGDNLLEITSSNKCPSCDAYMNLFINYDKNTIESQNHINDCIVKKEKKTISVTLDSPSGKIVFLNHPKNFFKDERENRYEVSINSTLGRIEETKFYASHNIGFFCVGNTVVDLMKKGNKISAISYNDEDDKEIEKYKNHENLGYVCCDVWWYTVLDYDLFINLCQQHNVDPESMEYTVAQIDSKKYKVVHNLKSSSDDYNGRIFSNITF